MLKNLTYINLCYLFTFIQNEKKVKNSIYVDLDQKPADQDPHCLSLLINTCF